MVSIVVPLFNAEKYVEKCIFSLITQTKKDIEILVIDDGSTDNSLHLVEKISENDTRVKVIRQENKGVSATRNLGVKYATGETICFVDADDYVENTYIESMYNVWDEETLVVCNFVHNDSTIKVLPLISNLQLKDEISSDFLVGDLGRAIAFSCCNKMFSIELLRQHNIVFPENVKIGEDMIFVLQYLSYAKQINCIDKGLYHYCIHNSSAMNAKNKNFFPDYCDTFNTLQHIELARKSINDEVISRWALDVLTTVFTNQCYEIMPYWEFRKKYAMYSQTPLFKNAVMCRRYKNLKRAILCFVLKIKCASLLFVILRINFWLRK